MLVHILNQHGNPLMPCSERKARMMLKEEKVKVVRKEPFTLQLLHGSSGYKQPISLGVDAGTKHIGLSATTEKKVLFEGEVSLRNDIVDLLADRRQYRRNRRYRKTRYRKPRFNNRTRPIGWLTPSVKNKVDTHIKVINLIHKLLPIKEITVEVAQFDTQLLKNPSIQGMEYQQGEQLGFFNVREYVLYRDKYCCQYCKGKSKDKVLEVHHIESRKTGGDSPGNLITLCKTCHDKIHQEGLEVAYKRKIGPLRDASVMTIMRWYIYNGIKMFYPHVKLTYGYLTKNIRITNGLEKSHIVDARCISNNPLAAPIGQTYFFKQVRKHNRQLHKANILKGGSRKKNQAPYLVEGFRLFDKVVFHGKQCFIFGRRSSGYFDLRLLDGTKVHASASYKQLRLISKANTLLMERRYTAPPMTEVTGVCRRVS